MKIYLSIIILAIGLTSHAQINQRTIALRSEYTKVSVLQLKEKSTLLLPRIDFNSSEEISRPASNSLAENYINSSSSSIQNTVDYFYDLKKQSGYSALPLRNNPALANPQIVINSRNDVFFRFFPGKLKD